MADITKTIQIIFDAVATSSFTQEFVSINLQFDKLELGLEATSTSAQEAATKLEFLRQRAQDVGVPVTSLGQSFVKLSEATKGTNIEGATTEKLFIGITNAAAKLGLDGPTAERALKAIEQIASKGKVSLEEVRGQLGDAIPGAVQIFAKASGTTVAEFYKLVEAGNVSSDVLDKVADILVQKYGGAGTEIDTLGSAFGRFENAVKELARAIGETGINDLIKALLNEFAEKARDATSGIKNTTEAIKGIREELEQGNYASAGSKVKNLYEAIADEPLISRLLTLGPILNTVVTGIKSFQSLKKPDPVTLDLTVDPDNNRALILEVDDAVDKLTKSAPKFEGALDRANSALKGLGVSSKTLAFEDFNKLNAGILELARNPLVGDQEFFTGFNTGLRKITGSASDFEKFRLALLQAYSEGKINGDQYAAGLKAIEYQQKGLFDAIENSAKATGKQGKEAKDAAKELENQAKAAEKTRLELEKIASNEKIKLIEAKVKLDIANVEANAKIAEAIINGIAKTYEADINLIKEVLDQVGDGYSSADKARLKIVDDANARINKLAQQQQDLVNAQIDFMRAKTAALTQGTPLITINGAGLQPHLEAFMWEILKAIQTRVSRDGLDLLLGVPAS